MSLSARIVKPSLPSSILALRACRKVSVPQSLDRGPCQSITRDVSWAVPSLCSCSDIVNSFRNDSRSIRKASVEDLSSSELAWTCGVDVWPDHASASQMWAIVEAHTLQAVPIDSTSRARATRLTREVL